MELESTTDKVYFTLSLSLVLIAGIAIGILASPDMQGDSSPEVTHTQGLNGSIIATNFETGGEELLEIVVSENQYSICQKAKDFSGKDVMGGYDCTLVNETHPLLR